MEFLLATRGKNEYSNDQKPEALVSKEKKNRNSKKSSSYSCVIQTWTGDRRDDVFSLSDVRQKSSTASVAS